MYIYICVNNRWLRVILEILEMLACMMNGDPYMTHHDKVRMIDLLVLRLPQLYCCIGWILKHPDNTTTPISTRVVFQSGAEGGSNLSPAMSGPCLRVR